MAICCRIQQIINRKKGFEFNFSKITKINRDKFTSKFSNEPQE